MATNDVIILDQILAQRRQDIAPDLSEPDFFEVFTAEQILKDYDLSYEEITSGIVGNGGDGGVDSIHIFVNGELLREDTDLSVFKRSVIIDLYLIQAKTSKSFGESAIDKFASVTEDLLDLSKPTSQFESIYNKELREAVENFRSAYSRLAGVFPRLRITYCYATKGSQANHTLFTKAEKLKGKVKQLFSSAECEAKFIGASELLEMARRAPLTTFTLNLTENPISSSGKVAFVCLVSLHEYRNFITDGDGDIRNRLFEANVRDYQGKTAVNEEIQASLRTTSVEDFWWLNNGVTILATNATLSGKALQIENPEIVNGLQTSREVFQFFNETNPPHELRNLLVRVIVPNESASRDRIIKATNSQTPISPASLRATDKIHRDIEEYFRPFGLYYDRRKNYYKNEGKPLDRIIGIPYLAQAVMAILLRRPDDARARPSSLLSRDDDYLKMFDVNYPIPLYFFCASLMKRIERFLSLSEFGQKLEQKTRGDIKFHIAMHAVCLVSCKAEPNEVDISKLEIESFNDGVLEDSASKVLDIYMQQGATNKVAKSPEFLAAVKQEITQHLNPVPHRE